MRRKYGLIAGGIIVFILVLLWALPYFISNAFVKREIAQQLRALTGYQVDIEGPLKVRFLPFPWAHAENVSVSNPSTPQTPPFMQIDALDANLEILPMLGGQAVIRKIDIEKPVMTLEVDAQGGKNWKGAMRIQAAVNYPSRPRGAKPANIMALPVKAIAIHKAQVSYRNAADNSQWTASDLEVNAAIGGLKDALDITASGILNNKPVSLEARLASTRALLKRGGSTDATASFKSNLLNADFTGTMRSDFLMGKLHLNASSLKDFANWIAPGIVTTPAPLSFQANGDLQCGFTTCTIARANVALDRIKARGEIRADMNRTPQININFIAGAIDFNAFLTPEGKKQALLVSDASADATDENRDGVPIGIPALNISLNATVSSDSLTYREYHIGHSVWHIKAENQHYDIDMKGDSMYGGNGMIALGFAPGSPPALKGRAVFNNIDLAPMLKATNNADHLSGKGSLQASFSSEGNTENEMVANLAGSGSLKIANGSIRGFNLADLIRKIQPALNIAGDNAQTAFTSMTGTYTIAKGIVTDNDLMIAASPVNMIGKGTINLPLQTIDYRLTPQLSGSNKKGGLINISVLIKGALDHPTFSTDAASALKAALKNPGTLKDKLKNSRDAVKTLLKGLGN